jgi:hypothetical protein
VRAQNCRSRKQAHKEKTTMTTPETRIPTPAAAKPVANGTAKADRKKPEHRQRSGVEAATAKVMNLIGRLSPGDQRKVMAAVGALTAKTED